jgi:hypothetical protein
MRRIGGVFDIDELDALDELFEEVLAEIRQRA